MDTNSSQIPSPLPEARKHPKLGIGSFISTIVALLFTCPFVLRYLGMLPLVFSCELAGLITVLVCLGGLAALVGTGLGIAAVVQKGTSKVFGILGIIISGLILLGFCAFGILIVWWLSGPYPLGRLYQRSM